MNKIILPYRKSVRFKGYDYSKPGLYYITICTQDRKCIFGEIVGVGSSDPKMKLNDMGKMVEDVWKLLPNKQPRVKNPRFSRNLSKSLFTASLHPWTESPRFSRSLNKYPVKLDVFQIMPNHVHFIIQITDNRRGAPRGHPGRDEPYPYGGCPNQSGGHKTRPYRANMNITLGDIVGGFKSLTTNEYIHGVKQYGWKPFDKCIWQRNYWEHVIRSEKPLNRIRSYIKNNPSMWHRDRNNPINLKTRRYG
jgi:putative transposase